MVTETAGDIRLVVFDWDGTLMDSEAQIVSCLHAAMNDLSLEALDDETVRNVIGLGLREAIETLVPGHVQDTVFRDAFVERYRHHWFNSPDSELFEGVTGMLELCRQHDLQLAVATGKSRRGLDRVLDSTGLAGMFAATRCSDEAPSKPHPQMLVDVTQSLEVRPGQTIMVGDTEYDMEMATNAGTGKIAVTCGVHSEARLVRHAPMASLRHVTELPEWLRHAGIIPE